MLVFSVTYMVVVFSRIVVKRLGTEGKALSINPATVLIVQ
jgi:hypothetical protein